MKRQDARNASGIVLPEPDDELDVLAKSVVDASIEVHQVLGPGYVEGVYEQAMCLELARRDIDFARQVAIAVHYKGTRVGIGYLDLLIAGRLVIELKAVEALAPIHAVQLRSYLKASQCTLGLLVNFNVPVLLRGVRRVIRSP